MSARLHASGTVCKASVRACPLGDSQHFTPEEFARWQVEQDIASLEGVDYSWTSESMDEQAAFLEEQDDLERRLAEHDAHEAEDGSPEQLSPALVALLHRNGISETEVTALSYVPDPFPAAGQYAQQSSGAFAATNPDGDHASCLRWQGEAKLWARGMEVAEHHYMEGEGYSIRRKGREVASLTPKYEQWILGARDVDLNWRPMPRTIGAYGSEDEALTAYADGAR